MRIKFTDDVVSAADGQGGTKYAYEAGQVVVLPDADAQRWIGRNKAVPVVAEVPVASTRKRSK